MCVCMCVCIYIYIHIYMYMYVCMYYVYVCALCTRADIGRAGVVPMQMGENRLCLCMYVDYDHVRMRYHMYTCRQWKSWGGSDANR